MTGKLVTRDERLTRLREQLQGAATVTEGRAASSKGARLLYGVALHGAARQAAGLELTILEGELVQVLAAVLPDEEEVRDFGQVYTEESVGRSHLFPDCLATRPVTEGYAEEDLARDLPALAPEIAAQTNVRVVDLDAVGGAGVRGARTDEEFARAAAEYGWGATVMTASGQEPAPANAPAIHARMSLTKFWCYKESNEWSASDELYWAVCSAADEGSERAAATREYEDVDKGETHFLDPNTIMFEGMVKNSLIVHIESWEKDQGSQADVQRMLAQMTTRLRTTAEKLALLPMGDWEASDAYSALAGMLADLVLALINMAADDWVAGHVFTYDRAALQRLSGPEIKLGYFGGSQYEGGTELYGRIDVATTDVNNIALITGNGTTWNTPSLPWPGSKTPDAPALAAVGSTLYCAVRGMNNQIYISRQTAGTWSGFAPVPGIGSYYAPALTAHNGQLYLAHTRTDGAPLVQSSTNGTTWTSPTLLQGHAVSGPALAVRNAVLHCAYASHRGAIWFNYSTNPAATAWTRAEGVTDVEANSAAPALASIAGNLHLVYRAGHDHGIYHRIHNGSVWQAHTKLPGTTADSPALVAFGNRLYCAVRGGGNHQLYISSTPNGSANSWTAFQTVAGPLTMSGPALATPNSTDLYLAYRTV